MKQEYIVRNKHSENKRLFEIKSIAEMIKGRLGKVEEISRKVEQKNNKMEQMRQLQEHESSIQLIFCVLQRESTEYI